MDLTKATASKQIFEGLKTRHGVDVDVSDDSPIDFLMVAGDGREDEVVFQWANELGREKIVKNVTTVTLGSRNTEASCTLTQGVTGAQPNFISPNKNDFTITNGVSGCLAVLQRLANLS